MRHMTGKTALIAHGGAMKTAYAGGFLYQLGKSGIHAFDYVAGTSGSTATAAYFVTGQYDDIRTIWLDYVAKNRDFVSLARLVSGRPPIDIPYLMHVLMDERPLDLERLVGAPSTLVLPMYNYTERRREYYTNRDEDAKTRIFETIQITMAIHGDHTVRRGNNSYADSEIEPFSLYCDTVIQGAEHVLVIKHDADEHFDVAKQIGTFAYRRLMGRGIPDVGHEFLKKRKKIFQKNRECFVDYCRGRDVYLHTPIPEAKVGWWTLLDGSEENIVRLFTAGSRAAVQFLKDPKSAPLAEALRSRSHELERAA